MPNSFLFCLLLLALHLPLAAQESFLLLEGRVFRQGKQALEDVYISSSQGTEAWSAEDGSFSIQMRKAEPFLLSFIKEGYKDTLLSIENPEQKNLLEIELQELQFNLTGIDIESQESFSESRHLRAVEDMSINATRKNELIRVSALTANLSNNNSRQLYAKVAGINIWENDNSGIQLNIGARGLSPNRTSNFNTRQNGYDISADALGYPETYYIPPAQALESIEIIRGAASLQYGTQFGGLLNFKLKRGPRNSPLHLETEQSFGSFGFFNSFQSIGGTVCKGKLNYYGFFQYKRGDGWRENAGFEVRTGLAALEYKHKAWEIRLEQTNMGYQAQQPGGLTDSEFLFNPRASKRERNWFRVNWNITALDLYFRPSDKRRYNLKAFGLFASRQSLGNLQPINRPDYGNLRDLIKGFYRNFGAEFRAIEKYQLLKRFPSTLLLGARVYRGQTLQQQGLGNAGSGGSRSDFLFERRYNEILKIDYLFPSFNSAFFAENYIQLGSKWTLTPGLRQEYIYTQANGSYQELVVAQGSQGLDTLRNRAVPEFREQGRAIFLAGIGLGFRPSDDIEFYSNISQNYRAINFNDMRILNPNQEIDPNLQDERGYNADLGFRGIYKKLIRWDFSLFHLAYKQRIGNISMRRPSADNPFLLEPYTLRSNIGDARIWGLESLIELNISALALPNLAAKGWKIQSFVNMALLDGRYQSNAASFAAGKRIEFLSPLTLRTGLSIEYKGFRLNYQYNYMAAQFSDASNAEAVANATVGLIPSYAVMDLSAQYSYKAFRLSAGVQNLTNAMYFSRRALSYPGPGIMPGEGRNFYIGLGYSFGLKAKS